MSVPPTPIDEWLKAHQDAIAGIVRVQDGELLPTVREIAGPGCSWLAVAAREKRKLNELLHKALLDSPDEWPDTPIRIQRERDGDDNSRSAMYYDFDGRSLRILMHRSGPNASGTTWALLGFEDGSVLQLTGIQP